MTARGHHSIGEVLALLRDEFPDVTISKIRFLESQGLIHPERTPSGYRKFYPSDIERLRWILTQQRDHFLPLKVIKRRLEADGGVVAPDRPVSSEPSLFARRSGAAGDGGAAEPVAGARPVDDPLAGPVSSVSLDRSELCRAAGLDEATVVELERTGLLVAVETDDGPRYDDECLLVARAAAELMTFGLGPRHLRMYKVAADREAGVLDQLAAPRSGPSSDAARLRRDLSRIVSLGETIHRSLLRRSLGADRSR